MKRFFAIAASLLTTSALIAGPALADPAQQETRNKVDSYTAIVSNPNAKADSDMRAVLSAQASLHPKPIESLTPEEARRQPSPADGVKKVMEDKGMSTEPDANVVTQDVMIGSNPARIYRPANADKNAHLPIIVYYHGGGWVIADIDTYDATPRALAKMTGAIVISAEYRHAPEHKFPAAHQDAFAAYKWALANAAKIGGDGARIALVGESAGGNLAINTAILARDSGIQMPVYEVLVYPVAGVDMMTKSYVENEHAKPLNKAMMKWFVKYTINSPKDLNDPRIDLIEKADLHELPPTTIVTAEIDPLRSEGKLLGERLQDAGVHVHAKEYTGVTHEFFGMGKVVKKAKQAEADVAEDLNAAFEGK